MQYNVLAATELSECDCRTVEIADQKILVARVGGRCHAIGAICPHAGAPLGNGVLRYGIIICLWQILPLSRSTAKARESAWSKRLDYVGHAEGWDDVVIDGDLQVPNVVAFYVRGGIVQAVAGWGRDQQMAAIIPLLTNRQDWSVTGLREAMPPAPSDPAGFFTGILVRMAGHFVHTLQRTMRLQRGSRSWKAPPPSPRARSAVSQPRARPFV